MKYILTLLVLLTTCNADLIDKKTTLQSETEKDIFYIVDLIEVNKENAVSSDPKIPYLKNKYNIAKKEFCSSHLKYKKYNFFFYGEIQNNIKLNTLKNHRFFELKESDC